jgi:hypothetical protein
MLAVPMVARVCVCVFVCVCVCLFVKALAVPTRWLVDGQRDEATMKLLRVRRQVRLY